MNSKSHKCTHPVTSDPTYRDLSHRDEVIHRKH